MADVKAAVLRILQEADLATLSERGVRDLLAEQFEWSSLEVDQHKAMIKVPGSSLNFSQCLACIKHLLALGMASSHPAIPETGRALKESVNAAAAG
jgi:hypothetical protein